MAIKNHSMSNPYPGVWLVEWIGLGNDDEGEPLTTADFADKTVEIGGVFGAGGSIALKGSNDPGVGPVGVNLTDPLGVEIDGNTPVLATILQNPLKVWPVVSGGDGDTDLNVRILLRTSVSGRGR